MKNNREIKQFLDKLNRPRKPVHKSKFYFIVLNLGKLLSFIIMILTAIIATIISWILFPVRFLIKYHRLIFNDKRRSVTKT